MNGKTLFITGATGFIGRHLVRRLDAPAGQGSTAFAEVRCLSRRPVDVASKVRLVVGQIENPASYCAALPGCDTVIHLAAVTGKARPAEFERINVDATRTLLTACKAAGVPRFIFVSSIAATYRDKSCYPYARSKEAAEEVVRASGVEFAIVRPTIVLGRHSPIWKSLSGMASLPIIPIFGNGRAKIQPIDVDDLADALIDIARLAKLPGDAIDLGGPEVLTMEDFLRRARRAIKGSEASVGHLPVGAMIAILRPLEPLLLPILPVTAGQLSGFTNDSTASPNAFFEARRSRMKGIEAMLDAYTAALTDTGA